MSAKVTNYIDEISLFCMYGTIFAHITRLYEKQDKIYVNQ